MPITSYKQLQGLFIPPEETQAKVAFGNPPSLPTFEEAKIIAFGVPFDDTATFGKGSQYGPYAMRHTSARQIETFVLDEGVEIYEKTPVFDLGDLRIARTLSDEERVLLLDENASEEARQPVLKKLTEVMKQFEVLKDIVRFIRSRGKIPLLLGGEHTLSHWTVLGLAEENPLILHFDAHRDAKEEYMGMVTCHTTWIRNVFRAQGNLDLVQIGVRQADKKENEFCLRNSWSIYPSDIRDRQKFAGIKRMLKEKTGGRSIYISFDIDALDIPYVPCTGTPEPFGLTPEEVVEIFKAIDSSARLAGMDMTEVAVRNSIFSEATTAVQLLLRLFARDYVK